MKTATKKQNEVVIPQSKIVKLKAMSSDELFLETLKVIGRPVLVRDMVAALKNGRLISKSKKKLMTLFYASASHLNRDGMLKRVPFNNSTYMYSLKGWNKQHKAAA